jgi:hypothetical protein
VRYFGQCVPIILVAGLLLTFVACRQQGSPKSEPLLLLEDNGGQTVDSPAGPVADNSRCYVCHVNYEGEALTLVHARADVGCQNCHGPSDAHCSDEDNITPPDTMFPQDKVQAFCMGCHTKEKIDIAVHNSVMAEADPKNGQCTACHGEHRLAHRTRRWDKVTRQLIKDDGVRMTEQMAEQK